MGYTKQDRCLHTGPDYLSVLASSVRVRIGTSTEFFFRFVESPKPESNRHLQVDETDVLPLHHQGLVFDVCCTFEVRKKKWDDAIAPPHVLNLKV